MNEVSVTRSPNTTHASVDAYSGLGEEVVDAEGTGEETVEEPIVGASAEVNRSVPRSLLDLHDAAMKPGLDGQHIQAWLDFEHEALIQGVPVEIGRDDLEALVEASDATRGIR